MKKVISIDIGYHNMGVVQAEIDKEFEIHILDVWTIDLPKLAHRRVTRTECSIPHTGELADLLAHFIQEFNDIFMWSDTIFIERQPPGGLTSVEVLLTYVFRERVDLVSPNSMHKHFMIGHLDYENRKCKTIQIAQPYLENFIEYTNLQRKHDIADAVCMIIFRNAKNKEKHRLKNIQKGLPFSDFIYNAPRNCNSL